MDRLRYALKYRCRGLSDWVIKRGIGPFRAQRRLLNKSQWWSQSELQDYQWQQFQAILRHAYATVPFYRRLLDERGIRPEHIQSRADVAKLPIVTKDNVRAADQAMVSTAFRKGLLHGARTGGSTGTPLIVYRDSHSIGCEHAFVRRQWDWAGIGLGDRCALLQSKVIADPKKTQGKLYQYIPFMRELLLSTHHLSAETALEYAQVMRRYRVKALVGYPSALSIMAQACLNAGVELPLRAALTTSETMTPKMRGEIERAFHCPVFDFYGSAERVCYIHTCEHGSYHVIPEYGLTEFVPIESGDAPRYKIIATGFWNRAMPLIRYDTGDVVVKTDRPCACGRVFPTIESIDGREGDVIRTPSGRQLTVSLISQILYVFAGVQFIAESQMIQDAPDHVTLEYVPTEKFTLKDPDEFRSLVSRHMPSEIRVDVREVRACKRTSAGKLRPVVSQLQDTQKV